MRACEATSSDGQNGLHGGINSVGVFRCVVVDALGEGVHVGTELRGLLLIPLGSAFIDSVYQNPLVGAEKLLTPILGGAAAGFAVEVDQ